MKKLTVSLMTALLLSTFVPTQSQAASETAPTTLISTPTTKEAQAAQVAALVSRLEEINAMDKSTLSKPEKRQLRKEVRSINKTLRVVNGGVYISAGALIIAVVLLLILL